MLSPEVLPEYYEQQNLSDKHSYSEHQWKSVSGEYIQCHCHQGRTGYTVSGNYCGFANSAGTGYTVITNSVSNFAGSVQAIIINTVAGSTSTVSNNVIGGYDLTSSRSSGTAGSGILWDLCGKWPNQYYRQYNRICDRYKQYSN